MKQKQQEKSLNKRQVIAELTKSAHGNLVEYMPVGMRAAVDDPDFFAHLIAWNHQKGQIRDAKIALPIIALASMARLNTPAYEGQALNATRDWTENALAHVADLRLKELSRVFLETTRSEKPAKRGEKITSIEVPPFMQTAKAPTRLLRRLLTRYLRELEADRRQFEYLAMLSHETLMSLYARFHVARPDWVAQILFNGEKGKPKQPAGGIFEVVRQLHAMPVEQAAGTIVKYHIPFTVARGALGVKANEPDAVLALIKVMSPTELITNMSWLDERGVQDNPMLRAALDAGLGRAATSTKATPALKAGRAAEAMALAGDTVSASKLNALQEKQLDKMGNVDGDWAVLGDCSGSMRASIDTAREVAAVLARVVKGTVHLIFFDETPYYFDVTGKTLDEIKQLTRGVSAGGGTMMGCGIQYLMDRSLGVDGIAFVGDGANHGPSVSNAYRKYAEKMDIEPTMYFYQLDGEPDSFTDECRAADIDVTTYDLRGQTVDYYSLPNVVQTMRVSRFSLIDEVLATPLRTLDEVLEKTKDMSVLPKQPAVHA